MPVGRYQRETMPASINLGKLAELLLQHASAMRSNFNECNMTWQASTGMLYLPCAMVGLAKENDATELTLHGQCL